MFIKSNWGRVLAIACGVMLFGTSQVFGQGGFVVPKNQQQFVKDILQQPNFNQGMQNAGVINANPQPGMQNPNFNPWANPGGNPGNVSPWTPNPISYQNPVPANYGYTPYNPYNPFYPYVDPFGGILRGRADLLLASGQSYATIITSEEKARYQREVAMQMKLQTIKMRFDLKRYIEENTPTFTERKLKLQKEILERIQNTANVGDIISGSSLNILLKDYQKHRAKKFSVAPLKLTSSVLQHLNVTASNGNLSLLKNKGEFQWPIALGTVLDKETREAIEAYAKDLVAQAAGGKIQKNTLAEMRTALDVAREKLLKKVNNLRTSQYVDAKVFLNEFDSAYDALKNGDGVPYFKFQQFGATERTVEELFEYMTDHGLTFSSATQTDRNAYLSAHANAAAFSLALNNQVLVKAE